MTTVPVIKIQDLIVDYKSGRSTQRAVQGISFEVNPGECVGFIGANGAGKSTTIKSIMGFVFPTSGTVEVLGYNAGTVASRQRIGYLPEVALYYPFMKARELLELYGGLQGMSKSDLAKRIPDLLERLGLGGKEETLLRNFSKGMQQRLGIAQAIISDPEALIFDELSSGLDPVGRFDLREVLLDLKRKGRTIFFSSHELSEVESLCDRVIIIHKGRIITQSSVAELMKPLNVFEVVFRLPDGEKIPDAIAVHQPAKEGDLYRVEIRNASDYGQAINHLVTNRAEILNTTSKVRSLEEHFISLVREHKEG